MRDFLASANYNEWVLPALLALPLAGAAVILLATVGRGRRSPARADTEFVAARWVALITLLAEFVLSL